MTSVLGIKVVEVIYPFSLVNIEPVSVLGASTFAALPLILTRGSWVLPAPSPDPALGGRVRWGPQKINRLLVHLLLQTSGS